MKQLWNALIERLVYWLTPKPHIVSPAPIVQAPETPLKPGICECGHLRCTHIAGKGACTIHWPPNKEWPDGSMCACRVFIPKKNNPPDPQPESPSPSVDELEKMFNV
jgi:hypothetical protein